MVFQFIAMGQIVAVKLPRSGGLSSGLPRRGRLSVRSSIECEYTKHTSVGIGFNSDRGGEAG